MEYLECKMRLRRAIRKPVQDTKPVSRLLILFFVFLTLITLYWFHLARRYNHLTAYGSGACAATLFFFYTDCELLI